MKKTETFIIIIALAVGAYIIFKKSTANIPTCVGSALPIQGPTLAQLTGTSGTP